MDRKARVIRMIDDQIRKLFQLILSLHETRNKIANQSDASIEEDTQQLVGEYSAESDSWESRRLRLH